MVWISCFISLLIFLDAIDLVTTRDPCKTEVGVFDMSLKGYVVKKVTALYVRMITCSGETKFQSFNYVIVEKSFTWVASMVEVHNWSSSFYIHFSHDFLIKRPAFKERMVFDCFVDK